MSYRSVLGLVLILLIIGCGGSPAPTPDLVATQIAVEEAAHATMTARAPTATPTSSATETVAPTASYTDTPVPTDTESPTSTSIPTETPGPSNTPTPTPAPTSTPSPEPTPTAQPKPTRKPTAKPAPVAETPSLDRYRVYFSNFLGNTIADQEHPVNYSVWSMRGDGEEPRMLFSSAQQPALSVDGTKLAYVQLASGVFVHDLTTGEGRHVINHTGAVSPSFSPDGYRISYAEVTIVDWWDIFYANSKVHTANVDGSGDATALVGRRPAWSPVSSEIVYEACQETTCGLMVLNTDNGATRLLVGQSAGKASWSPDGRKITYSTDADGDSEIWSINLDGTGAKKLTDNMSTDALAAWTPDGNYLYFLSDRMDGWGIWVMRPDGKDQRKVQSIGVPQHWQWAKMTIGWDR